MKNQLFIISLLFGLTFYVFAILYIPDFITDDYLIFTYISLHPSNPIVLDPSVDFFLFTRPLSYFTFWLDYQLFYNNAMWMKFESLLLFILSVILLYYTLKLLLKYIKVELPEIIILLGTLFYLFHPDSLTMNVWVSNRTELLNIVFYLSSIFFFLKYLEKRKSKLLIFSIICYFLTIISKQSGLHLPIVLFLFYYFIVRDEYIFERKIIYSYFIISGVLLIIITTFNIYYTVNDFTIFFQYLLKKPFAIIGISILTIQPLLGEILYNYFILYKYYALTILIFLSIFIVLFYKNHIKKIRNNKVFLLLITIFLVSFFPRIQYWGTTRINSIQLFWLIVIVLFISSKYIKHIKLIVIIFSLLITLNILSVIYYGERLKDFVNLTENRISFFIDNYKNSSAYVTIDPDIKIIPYQLHYYKTNQFGKDEIPNSSVYYRPIILNANTLDTKQINCEITSGEITITSIMEDVFILYDVANFLEIINLIPSPTGRGYSSVTFKIPSQISKKKLIYFDGARWHEL